MNGTNKSKGQSQNMSSYKEPGGGGGGGVGDKLRMENDKQKHYYQITVRRTAETSARWKVIHVALFALTAVFGFQACFCYGRAFSSFNFNCVLDGAKLAFRNSSLPRADLAHTAPGGTAGGTVNDSEFRQLAARGLPAIDYQGTKWGSTCACNFVQFMPLVQMVAAVIWGAFFVGTSRGGGGLAGDPFLHPWRIVGPLLVFCALLLVPLLVARHYSSEGYSAFCHQFHKVLTSSKSGKGDEDKGKCDVDVYTTQFSGGRRKPFTSYISTAIITEKLCLGLWLGQLAVTLIRIITFGDFQINRITIKNAKQEAMLLTHEPEEI